MGGIVKRDKLGRCCLLPNARKKKKTLQPTSHSRAPSIPPALIHVFVEFAVEFAVGPIRYCR